MGGCGATMQVGNYGVSAGNCRPTPPQRATAPAAAALRTLQPQLPGRAWGAPRAGTFFSAPRSRTTGRDESDTQLAAAYSCTSDRRHMTRPPHLQATLTVTDADDSTAGDAVDPVSTNTTDSGDTDHKVDNDVEIPIYRGIRTMRRNCSFFFIQRDTLGLLASYSCRYTHACLARSYRSTW
jgi:hypothetical protein